MAIGIHKINRPRDFTAHDLNPSCMPLPEYVYHTILTATANKAITVPAGATHALVSSDNVAVTAMKVNGAAATPASDVVDGTGSTILSTMPTLYSLEPQSDGTVISNLNFISAGTPKISISWWKLY
jgi:hypothetical protein